jgi:hypothetical protein
MILEEKNKKWVQKAEKSVEHGVFPKDFFATKKSAEGYVRGLLKYSNGDSGKAAKRLNFYINRNSGSSNISALRAALKILEKRNKLKKESIYMKTPEKYLTEKFESLVESHGEEENKYINYYKCPRCNEEWQDYSPSKNNDRCPKCDDEIEPYKSEDIIEETQDTTQPTSQRDVQEYLRRIREVESAPLQDRKEAQAEWFKDLKNPDLIKERIEWLIDGNYGYAEMMKAVQILKSPRMNRVAALAVLIAQLEWMCPRRMATDAWLKLTPQEQEAVNGKIKEAITEWEANKQSEEPPIEEKKLSPKEIEDETEAEEADEEDSRVKKIERPQGSLRKSEKFGESLQYDQKFLNNAERWMDSGLFTEGILGDAPDAKTVVKDLDRKIAIAKASLKNSSMKENFGNKEIRKIEDFAMRYIHDDSYSSVSRQLGSMIEEFRDWCENYTDRE